MLKVALPVALVVLAAIIWFTFWLGKEAGKKLGEAKAAKERGAIDPALYDDMHDYLSALFRSVEDPDRFVMMPDDLDTRGRDLLNRSARTPYARRRS